MAVQDYSTVLVNGKRNFQRSYVMASTGQATEFRFHRDQGKVYVMVDKTARIASSGTDGSALTNYSKILLNVKEESPPLRNGRSRQGNHGDTVSFFVEPLTATTTINIEATEDK